MKWFMVFLLFSCCSANAEEDYSLLKELAGKWEGRWDGKFGVKFKIEQADKEFNIKYYVEETIGEPYVELEVKGSPLNKNSVMAGTLYFIVSLESEGDVTVVGIFDTGTRTAKLKRLE